MGRALCKLGIHYSGTIDGGGMGDAMTCDVCGISKYPEVFPGFIIHERRLGEPPPAKILHIIADPKHIDRNKVTLYLVNYEEDASGHGVTVSHAYSSRTLAGIVAWWFKVSGHYKVEIVQEYL